MRRGPGVTAEAVTEPAGSRWGAFAYPNYRRFWFASLARVFGLQFRIIGAGWLVGVDLDRSPIWLGIVGLCSALPTIVLSVPAGALADRIDNQRLLIVSQTLSTVTMFALAVTIVSDVVEIWMVIAWALASGTFAALANPAQQAMLPRLIEMRAMASAVAFNSSIWNGMRIVGPAAGGVLIAVIGTGQAFFVTAAGYAVSTVLIAMIHLEPVEAAPEGADRSMLGGLRYIVTHRLFLAVVGLSFFTSIFGMSYQILLPIFTEEIMGVGSIGFGAIEMATGVGALIGTLSVVKLGASRHAGLVMIGGAAVFGLLVAGFSYTRVLPVSMVLIFAAGFSSSVYLNVGMTVLQIAVPNELRGRVMGVWSMTWFLASVGGFVAGAAAEVLGVPHTIAIGALSVTAFALVLYGISAELRHPPVPEEREAESSPAHAAAG